jgi:cytochrome c-type biogenesis protein CcmH
MRRWLALLGLLLCLVVSPALAATSPDELLQKPEQEQRARELSQQLRCLVCQNQSIDDSDAELARDLRTLVRERIVAGDSDEEIIAYFTERYGDFILLKPPVEPATWGLWFGPALVLVVAGLGLALYLRRRSSGVRAIVPLSHDERSRLDALVAEDTRPPAAPGRNAAS